MQRIFCDACKEEIKQNAHDFIVEMAGMSFGETHAGQEHQSDICLPCLIKAINKEAQKALKRKYIRKQIIDLPAPVNIGK